MPDAPDPNGLDKLQARIEAAKAARDPGRQHHDHHSAAGAAWRMVIELVVGMGIALNNSQAARRNAFIHSGSFR